MKAGFTVADMARWLRLPWETVYAWLKNINNPMDHSIALIEERLGWIEEDLKKHDYLPVPLGIKFRERPKYVEARRDHYEQRAATKRRSQRQR